MRIFKSNRILVLIIIAIALMIFAFIFGNYGNEFAFAEGEEPFDSRARIGFQSENFYFNEFYLEENNGSHSIRVYISQAQSQDVAFTLSEERYQCEDNLFVFASSYTLAAGSSYVDAQFHQVSNAESGSGVRLSDIYIHCDTTAVTVGDVEYYGEDEFCDNDFLAVVYDRTGDPELIIEPFPFIAEETKSSVSARLVRSGEIEEESAIYYRLNDYAPTNFFELKFDNYNSVLAFNENEREKTLVLQYFDNDHINLSQSFEFEYYNMEGITKVFNLNGRRYLDDSETANQILGIFDDESTGEGYKARVHYYQPESRDDYVGQITEGGLGEIPIFVSSFNESIPLPAFNLYYTVELRGNAFYDTHYVLGGNYSLSSNLGYIEVPEGGTATSNQYEGKIYIHTIDNTILDGTKNLYISFFVYNSEVMLQPIRTVRFEITDNEHTPYNDTINWYAGGSFNCPAFYDEEDQVLTLEENSYTADNCVVGIASSYSGMVSLDIPIVFTDITAIRGIDYNQQSQFGLMTYYPNPSRNRYSIDFDIPTFDFSGVRRFKISIIEEGLTNGLTLTGSRDLYVDIVGRLEADYTYVDYTEVEKSDIFSIGHNETLNFTLKRIETYAVTTYVDVRESTLIEGTHIAAGLFPYAVEWSEGEIEKAISFEFLDTWGTTSTGNAALYFLNSDMQILNNVYGEEHSGSVYLTLYTVNSAANYYFQGDSMVSGLTCEYKYSVEELRIEVKRDLMSAESFDSSIEYYLTFDYDAAKSWQIIVSQNAAEIGTHINALSGTLYFYGTETTKYIQVTVPDTISMPLGSKYVNVRLQNPSEKTYILRDWDYDGKFDTAKIKITNDTSPVLEYSGITTTTVDESGYDKTYIYPLSDKNKENDVFGVRLVPYEYGQSQVISSLYLPFSLTLLSQYDLSLAGVEVWFGGEELQCSEIEQYVYFYTDGEGGHSTIYNYAYTVSTRLNNQNPSAYFTIKYVDIAAAGLDFISTNLLLATESEYFMTGCEVYEQQLSLIACSSDATIELLLSPSAVVSEGAINLQLGDTVYFTVMRTSTDVGTANMFFASEEYTIKTVPNVGEWSDYYFALDETFIFQPYEKYKKIAFVTQNVFGGGIWDDIASTVSVELRDSSQTVISEYTVHVLESWEPSEIDVTAELAVNEIKLHKISGDDADVLGMKFTLSRSYDQDITLTLQNLDARLENLIIIIPHGQIEYIHYFEYDEEDFYEPTTQVNFNALDVEESMISLHIAFDTSVSFVSETITAPLFEAILPEIDTINEDGGYVDIILNAYRTGEASTWTDAVFLYSSYLGSAVYETNYYISCLGTPKAQTTALPSYDISSGIIVIPAYYDQITLRFNIIDNAEIGDDLTLSFSVFALLSGYRLHTNTMDLTIVDNEYQGDFSIEKLIAEDGSTLGIKFYRENNTACQGGVYYNITTNGGVINVDYVLQNNENTYGLNGAIFFNEQQTEFILYIVSLTPAGQKTIFTIGISPYGEKSAIKNSKILLSLDNVFNIDGFSSIAERSGEINYKDSNYKDYLLSYTIYYPKYVSSANNIKVATVDIGFGEENIYYSFNYNGTAQLSSSARSGSYVIPSGAAANCWYDIDGDGVKELIFVVNLDSCFGGQSELMQHSQYGVYALNIIDGTYTTILSISYVDALSNHYDVYIYDADGDGDYDAAIFSSTSSELSERAKGINMLYIVTNNTGEFSTNAVIDGYTILNEGMLKLYGISVMSQEGGRVFLRVYYYLGSSRDLAFCSWVDVMSQSLSNHLTYSISSHTGASIRYNGEQYQITEGQSFRISFYNDYRISGSITVTLSGTAQSGTDYYPQTQTIIINFNGEYYKTFNLLTFNNNFPDNGKTVIITLSSEDFVFTAETEHILFIDDVSSIAGEVAYTILDEFNEDYESSAFITGDRALASTGLLTVNGNSVDSISDCNIRFFACFGGTTWVDEDNDGELLLTGLEALWLSSQDEQIIFTVEFRDKYTDALCSYKTYNVTYLYFDDESQDCRVDYEIDITSTVFEGQKLSLRATSTIHIGDVGTPGAFSVVYTNTADNRTYTFYSDNVSGIIDAQIDFGTLQGIYSHSYVLSSQTVNASNEENLDIQLNLYQNRMDFPLAIYNSVKGTLFPGVSVKVQGINVYYHFDGKTNSEDGTLVLRGIVPLRKYWVTVNEDEAMPYFQSYAFQFIPSLEQTSIAIDLQLIGDSTLDNIALYVISPEQLVNIVTLAYDLVPWQVPLFDWVYDYLAGKAPLPLDDEWWLSNANRFINEIFKYIYLNPSIIKSIAKASYIVTEDAMISRDFPQAYKSLNKDEEDITLLCYRYNPETVAVSVKLSGTFMTEDNCVKRSAVYYFPQECVQYYAFSGAENCILDIVIESGLATDGILNVQLANFGTGLGSYLMQPVHEIFESLGTAPIPDSFAFINGMSFLLSFTDIDFASNYDEENRQFSIYMGASKDLYEASHGMEYGDIGRPTLSQLRAAKAAGLGTGHGQAGFGVGLGGKMIFQYDNNEWSLVAGEIYFSVSASYNYTKYILLPVISIPAFFSATISLDIGTTIYFNWNEAEEYIEVTGDLAIELAVEIECGVGIKGFLSASVYGRAGIEIIIQMESGATKLTLYVEGGVRIQILFWKYQYSFGRAEWSTQSGDYIERTAAFSNTTLAMLAQTTQYTGVAKLYNIDSELIFEMGLGEDGMVQDIVLVSNVYENGAPQIAELEDGTKMIAWINYDESRGANNAEVINYIYFDGENWSDVNVVDQTLTADLSFEIVNYNDTFAILCIEVKEELSFDATISDRLLKSDAVIFVFDTDLEIFSKTVLTNNEYNDRQAVIAMDGDNGIIVIYRSENTNINDDMSVNDFLCGDEANNRLYFSVYNAAEDNWTAFTLLNNNLPPVANMSIKIVGGLAYLALECDWDEDFDTSNDREIVLIQYVFATEKIIITRITENFVNDSSPELVAFNGKIFMAYRSGDDIMYWYENQSYYICTLPQSYTEFAMFASNEYAVLLFTSSVEGIAQVFAAVMDIESMQFSIPAQITFGEKPARSPVISLDSDGFTLYYIIDTYTLISQAEEEFDFNVTSEIATRCITYQSDLSIEIAAPDYSQMTPEEEFTFTVRIYNTGLLNINDALLKAYIGEQLAAQVVVAFILGNGYSDVEIAFTLPSHYASITFTIEKDGLDEDTEDSAQIKVLLYDAAIAKDYTLTTNQDGSVTFSLIITNNGNIDIKNLEIRITGYSNPQNVYLSYVISTLTVGETKNLDLTIAKSQIQFNANNELWLKVYAIKQEGNVFEIATDDYLAGDNVRSLCVVRQTFENGSTLALLTETLTIDVGANGYFDFMYTGDGEINITSSDTTIFSINNRTITALKAGTAVLTISDGTQIKTMNVTVNALGGPSEDPEEPEDPEDPEAPVNPEESQDSEEPEGNIDNGASGSIKWLTYVAFAMVFLLLAGGITIWILIKKGKIKIKK